MRSNNINMLSGSITKGLLSMTIPIMVMNVLQILFNIIDMAILRYFSSESAVGAVGACGQLISLCTSLLIGMSVGANIIVAKRIGSENNERSEKAVMTSILFSIVSGVVLMLIGVIFAETFLKMTNCPYSLLPQAIVYFKIYFYGVPILMFNSFCCSVLRATGDTKRPMYFQILSGIIKVLLTFVFVTVFDADVEAVAFATIVAQLVAGFFAFLILLKYQNVVRVNLKQIKFNFTELKDMLQIGVPAGFQSALYSLANVLIITTVNSFGAAATTGIAIANQFDGVLYQVSMSPSFAVSTYVAQNVGANQINRIPKIIIRAILITTMFGATLGSLSAIFSKELSSIMSTNPEVIQYSQQKMIIVSSTYFICGINEIFGGVLRGMGKPNAPTIATLLYMCAFRFVWIYSIFPLIPNLTFLYTVWPIGWILSIINLVVIYVITMKKWRKNSMSLGA